MLRVSLALVAMAASLPAADAATVVPTVYEAGHFFATPTTTKGQRLRLLVDTGGGGISWTLYPDVASRIGSATSTCADQKALAWPAFAPGQGLPLSTRLCGKVQVPGGPRLGPVAWSDGMVGGWYLSDFTWTFDYPGQRLSVEDASWKPDAQAHATPLGFPRNNKGTLGSPFARITLTIDGEPLDVLLDTGATAHPTPKGLKAMGTPVVNGYGVTSYITTSVMTRWHEKHPDWPLVEQADDIFGAGRATRAIQVPAVTVAGWSVGPVWFTERGDANFVDTMSSYMDGTVYGAAGGNLLQAFRMSIDYAHGKAYFTCVNRCVPAK